MPPPMTAITRPTDLELLRLVGDEIGEGGAQCRLGVQRGGTGKDKTCLGGHATCLDVQVVQNLEMVRGETGRAHDYGAHPFAWERPQPVEDVGAQPWLGRPAGTLPSDVEAFQ